MSDLQMQCWLIPFGISDLKSASDYELNDALAGLTRRLGIDQSSLAYSIESNSSTAYLLGRMSLIEDIARVISACLREMKERGL